MPFTARIIENLRTKCIIFGETLRFRGKKFKQNLTKNCSKNTKMVTTVCKLSKIFRGSIAPDPPRAFFILKMQQIILREKTTLENVKIWYRYPSQKKFLNTPQT